MEKVFFENELVLREATNADAERIKSLVFGVLREFGLEPDPVETDSDLNNIDRNYFKRGGSFDVIVDKQDNIVGTVGIYPITLHICELRKMYFDKSIRGKGYGRKILERTVKEAKCLGFTQMTLETASILKAAIYLYESFGFRPFTPDHHAARSDQAYYLDI